MALRLQQALVNAPLTNLRTESIRTYLHALSDRFGLSPHEDLSQQFYALLSTVFEASLGFWICDYVATVCADKDYSSSDPEEFQLLQPQAVLGWAAACAQQLHKRLLGLLQSGPAPEQITDLGHATKTLLSVAQTVQAALGGSSASAAELVSTLQLLHHTTQVLQWLEQQHQQRPGVVPPLISRSTSMDRTGRNVAAGGKPCPSYKSVAAWQAAVAGKRKAAAGGRLFLDDITAKLHTVSDGQRPFSYPFPDVLSAVEGMFMSGTSSSEAWQTKLSVLLYYMLDGGWLSSAAAFAQGFQLPLTLVQQWQCHYLMDCATAELQQQEQQQERSSGSSTAGSLDAACNLLGAIAGPATPFRFVEALLVLGRPTTALAVQRARCAASSSSSSVAMTLTECQVLLRVQLGCGLLPEAFSELRRHCSQLPLSQRPRHVTALMHQLAAWAVEADTQTTDAQQQQQQSRQQQQQQQSRQQQLVQLPLDTEEEAALFGWYKQRMTAALPGGHMLPLYLLQRGRTLEALSAYAVYQASPAGTAAAAAAAGSSAGDAVAAAVLHRQLQTLMSAAAAALPPSLRATVTAAAGSSSSRAFTAGSNISGGMSHATQGSVPSATLQRRGIEPPVFLSPLVPATPATGAYGALGLSVEGLRLGSAGDETLDQASAAAAGNDTVVAAHPAAAGNRGHVGQASLFGDEVLAAAGPGSVAISAPQQGGLVSAGNGATAATGAPTGAKQEFVPLLFGTPAPTAAAAGGGGLRMAGAAAGAATPGLFGGSGFGTRGGLSMTEDEFSRDVLGVGVTPVARTSASAKEPKSTTSRRISKRLKQTPTGC